MHTNGLNYTVECYRPVLDLPATHPRHAGSDPDNDVSNETSHDAFDSTSAGTSFFAANVGGWIVLTRSFHHRDQPSTFGPSAVS